MKGLFATLILGFVITGTSAQYCGECYQPILDFYDWIADNFGSFGIPFGEYAAYLRYIKSIREQYNCRGTAYAMDQTASLAAWTMQKNVAFATTIINPASNDCNPFFLNKYRQLPTGSGLCASASGGWQCLDRCEAADAIDGLNFIEPENLNWPDYLRCGCHHASFLSQNNVYTFNPCAHESISKNEMLLAFYNSNDQVCGTACNNFPTRISTKVNGPGGNICGFQGRDLNWSHFLPALWMKNWLSVYCCPNRRSSSRSEGEGFLFTDGEQTEATNATTEAEFAKLFPGSGGVSSNDPRVGDDDKTTARLARFKRGQTNTMKRALRLAGQNGFDLGGWNPLEETDEAKPARGN